MAGPADNSATCGNCGLYLHVKGCSSTRCASRLALGNPSAMSALIEQHVSRQLAELMAYRERYVMAWIAETGIAPSEAMLVERRRPDGSLTITVEPRPGRMASSGHAPEPTEDPGRLRR